MKLSVLRRLRERIEAAPVLLSVVLRRDSRFSLEGLLCELFREETSQGHWIEHRFFLPREIDPLGGEGWSGCVPLAVVEWAGSHRTELEPLYEACKQGGKEAVLALLDVMARASVKSAAGREARA